MNSIRITDETIENFGKYLQSRGCYTASTITVKVSIARAMRRYLKDESLPLDDGAAIDRINTLGIQGRRKCEFTTTARDLLASYRWAAGVVQA